MTSPSGGGGGGGVNRPNGGDDVVKVVYQAIADYSQLMRATRQARAETAELKREISGIGGQQDVRVRVTADTGQAQAEIARVVKDVIVKIKLTVDAVAAQAEIARVVRDAVVKVKVTVDAIAAKAELNRVLKDTAVQVSLALRSESVARFRREVEQAVKDATVKVGLQLDRTAAIAKMRALITYLQAMGPVKIAVDLSGYKDDLDALEARLRRLRRDAGPGGGGGPPADPDSPTPAPRPRPRPSGPSGDVRQVIPQGIDTAVGLLSKFIAIVAAATPLAGALALGVGAVGSALLAAGASAAIFATVAIGAFARVSTAAEAASKSAAPLEGETGRVVSALNLVKSRYNELLDATQAPIFDVFIRGLDLAVDLLNRVQPYIAKVADAIDGALTQVQDAVNGPGFGSFLEFTDRQGPAAIGKLTTALIGLIGGLGGLLQAFEPFVSAFLTGFAEMATEFQTWSSTLDSNAGFQDFLNYALQALPLVFNLFTALVSAIANIVTALAPLGNLMLIVATAAAKLIGALPPQAVLLIATSILGLAAALKAVKSAAAVVEAVKDFSAALPGLAARLGVATGAINATRIALVGLGASLGIGLLLTGISLAITALGNANEKAAEQARDHRQAADDLASSLRSSGGQITTDVREQAYNSLRTLGTKDAAGKTGFSGTFYDPNTAYTDNASGITEYGGTQTRTLSLPEAAKTAGVDLGDLTLGSIGDDAARKRAIAGFDEYIAARQKLIDELNKNPAQNKQRISELQAEQNIVKGAKDAYLDASTAGSALAESNADLAAATGQAVDKGEQATTVYASQAEAADALRKALKAATTATDEQTAAQSAFAASDAYTAAKKAYDDYKAGQSAAALEAKSAEDALTDAQIRAKDAQEALNDAREAAKQRLIDLQRQLRDLPLDEEQARLNVEKSDQALAQAYNQVGVDPLDLRQQELDNQRAHNSLNDFLQDKPTKQKDIQDELGKGLAGNKQLRDAQRQNTTAQTNLAKAEERSAKAKKALNDEGPKLYKAMVDARTTFIDLAAAMGLSTTQVDELRTKMDELKSKQITVTVDLEGDEKLRAVLQYQEALKLLAAHPDWTLEKALTEAAKQVPTAGTPASTGGISKRVLIEKGTYADGGPAAPPGAPTAGPVYGPGTGTSDSVHTVLPVGGPSRLSAGEHIVTDAEVRAAPGGHGYVEAFRQALRSGVRWAPVGAPATGGWGLSALSAPAPRMSLVPGYAAGGPVQRMQDAGTSVSRSVTVNGGIHVTNATPEPASTSLYTAVRKLGEPDLD